MICAGTGFSDNITLDAETSCVSQGMDYTVTISNISGGVSPYTISYTDCTDNRAITGIINESQFSGFCYDPTKTQNEQKLTVTVTDSSTPPCELTTEVFPLNCSEQSICDCCATGPLNINVQASGMANGFSMVYVLTDTDGIILAYNETGSFSDLTDATDYISYAINVEDTDLGSLSASIVIGSNIDNLIAQVTPFDEYCYTIALYKINADCECSTCSEIKIQAHPICNGDGSFTISIDAVSGGDPDQCSDVYTVVNPQGSFLTFSAANLPQLFGTYNYTNQNDKIALTFSDDDEMTCSSSYDVLQLNCTSLTTCDCSLEMPLTISTQAAANGNGYGMLYVLTDDQDDIIAVNQNGEFAGLLGDGSSSAVYAFNVIGADLMQMQQEIMNLIGSSIDAALLTTQSSTFADFCYIDFLPFELSSDCECPRCSISNVDLTISACNDNGTTSTSADDFFSFTLGVTQSDIANFSSGFVFDGSALGLSNSEMGSYGNGVDYTSPMINLNAIGTPMITLLIMDQDDHSCRFELELLVPSTCSVPNCEIISVKQTVFPCDDNQTPNDPRDDFFGFSLSVEQGDPDSFNNGFTFDGSALGLSTSEMGAYGMLGYSSPMINIEALSGTSVSVTIRDVDDPSCSSKIDIAVPEICSSPTCTITADVASGPICQDGGTAGDPSDDTYIFEVMVTGNNTAIGASMSFSDNGSNTGVGYGTLLSYGPFLISNGVTTLSFMDDNDLMCIADIQVSAPATCSDASCIIETMGPMNIQCSDSGTPADASDDTFTFDLIVDAMNDFPSSSSTFGDDQGNSSVAYGSTVSYGPYSISQGTFNILISDSDVSGCSRSVTVDPPESCSACPMIEVTAFPSCSSIGATFDVMYDLASTSTFAITETQTNTTSTSQAAMGILEDFSYTNQNDKFTLIFTDEANDCAYTIEVLQLRCSEQTQCNCSLPDPFSIAVQASGDGSIYSMLYALVDNNDVIIDVNQIGIFSSLPDDQVVYDVYAFNVTDSDLVALQLALQSSIVITDASGPTQTEPYRDLCYNFALTSIQEDCDCTICQVELLVSADEICIGDQVELTINIADGQGPYEVLIDTDGDISTAEIILTSVLSGVITPVMPMANTTYELIAVIDQANNNEVCENLNSVDVSVSILPPLIIEEQRVCADVTSVNLVSLQMNLPYIFTWANVDGLITDPTDVDPRTGPFILSYTDGGVCMAETMVDYIINPLPSVTISGGGIICTPDTGMPTSLTLKADPGFASYDWASSEGGIITNTADPAVIVVTTGGTYQVDVTDMEGCTATADISIEERDCTACSPIMADVESVCLGNETYAISVNSITGGNGMGDDFSVEIPGVAQISFPSQSVISDLVFDATDGVQSAITLIITDADANLCQTTVSVFELNCADQEVCDCTMQNPYSINVQATADADQSSLLYVLVNVDVGGQIVGSPNQVGSFGALPDNTNFIIYAFNIDSNDVAEFNSLVAMLTEINDGDDVLMQSSSFEDLCYDYQLVELIEDCSCDPCRAELMLSASEICLGETVELVVNILDGDGPYSILIDSDGDARTAEIILNSVQNGATVTITPDNNVTYQIISVEDEFSNELCNSMGAVQVLVTVLPKLPIADQVACADVLSVDLTALVQDFSNFTFTWSNLDGVIMNPSDVDPNTGPFTYTYTDGGACTAEDMINFTILPLPVLSITGDSEICQSGTGSPSNLELSVDPSYSIYDWTAANGGMITGVTDGPMITISSAGEYMISVIDDNGCSASATTTVSEINCTICSPIQAIVTAECETEGTYKIVISSVAGGDDLDGGYRITVNSSITINYPSVTEIGGLTYVGADDRQGKINIVIEDEDSSQCTANLSLFELNCTEQESCDCTAPQPYTVQVQASGSAADYEMLYVLVDQDNAGLFAGAPNQDGTFASFPDNTNYTIYAFTIASSDFSKFSTDLINLRSIIPSDPILLQQAPFDNYCYDVKSVDLIEDCGCNPIEACLLSIETITASCDLDHVGLYQVQICLDVFNSTSSEFTVMIDSEAIGEYEYADLDANGCIWLSAQELNLIADGSEGIEVKVQDGPLSAESANIYISELHYDNAGPDENEMVEITAPKGTDLAGYELLLYNGSSGNTYGMPLILSGIIDDRECGALAFSFDGIQNGPDAIALVDSSGMVLDFISYEGSFLANAGPAQGLTSVDIMVAEGDETSSNQSLIRTDDGWQVSTISSFGIKNENLRCLQNRDERCGDSTVFDEPRCIFDIALTKVLSPASISPFNKGDAVSFDIIIYNQGNVDATEIDVSDYFDPLALSYQAMTTGMLMTQLSNVVTVTEIGAGEFSISSLPLGDQITVTLDFIINPAYDENIIINNAEIIRSSNANNLPDIDSEPGDNADSAPDLMDDDDPTVGNDDFDPAVINLCAGELSPPIVDEILTVCAGDMINIMIQAGRSERPIKATSLFFSEYLEGSSRNKCLEIFNGTGGVIDLTDWSIQTYNNGSSTGTSTFFPDGILINDGDVFVLCNSGSDSTMIELADILLNAATNFNGNDDIVLVDPEGVFVDVIGTIGSALDFGTNQSFIRNCDISTGRTDGSRLFIPTDEWEIIDIDDIDNLGKHNYCATGLFPDDCSYQVYLQDPANGIDPVLSGVQRDFNINELDTILNFPHVLFITCVSPTGCESNPSEITLIVQEDQALACNDRIQVSLGDSCQYEVTPDLLLEADMGLSFYDITMSKEDGSMLGTSVITKRVEGETLQYVLTDLCTGNSCRGELSIEVKFRPVLSSPCEFILGSTQYIEADFSVVDHLSYEKLVNSDCQSLIVNYENDLKYDCGFGAAVEWCAAGVDIIIRLGNDTIETRKNLISNTQIVISNANPGSYTVDVKNNHEKVSGEFNLSIATTNCEPSQTCELICGVNESVRGGFFRDAIASNGFMSLNEARSTLRNSCFQTVTDIISQSSVDEDFCEAGSRTIISYFGTIINHEGISEKINLITQAYVERSAEISDILTPSHVSLPCGASTHPDSIFDFFNQANNAISDSVAVSQAYPYFILKNADGDTLKRNATIEVPVIVHYQLRVDTVKVERYINGEWLLVDLINKELRDSIRYDRERKTVTRLNPIPIAEEYCGYIINYEDIVVPACGSGVKVLRSWSIIDWCDQRFRTLPIQQIENDDDAGPEFTPLDDQNISISSTNCVAAFMLPEISIEDDCSADDAISVHWQTRHGKIEDGIVRDLKQEDSPVLITLTVTDECGNRSMDSMRLHISDQIAPVAICVDELRISITDGDLAVVSADAFDAESHDFGCGEVWIKVIREADLRGTEVGFWNTKGPRRAADYDLRPDPSFAYRYTCANEEADDFRATYFDENRNILGIDIGRQVFFDDQTSFCCTDINEREIMVVVRVFDRDPGEGAVDPRRMIQDTASPTLVPDRRNKNRLIQSTNFVENDLYGHYTDCWVKVILANKIEPEIVCDSVTISCTDDLKAVAMPTSSGGICELSTIRLASERELSSGCSIDSVIRQWYIDADDDGIFSDREKSCTQTISISSENQLLDPLTIKWPKHYDGSTYEGISIECDSLAVVESSAEISMGESFSCVATYGASTVTWCDPECSLVAYSVAIDTIESAETCMHIIRRHSVIDWCLWTPNAADEQDESDRFQAVEDWAHGACLFCGVDTLVAEESERIYFRYAEVNVDGLYEFDQILKIIDDTDPQIIVQDTFLIRSSIFQSKDEDIACEISGIIHATAKDFCGEGSLQSAYVNWEVTVSDGTRVVSSHSVFSDSISIATVRDSPGETYRVEWHADDACGNHVMKESIIIFLDDTPPVPVCIQGVSTASFNEEEGAAIRASDFDLGSYDNCGISDFTITGRDALPILPQEEGFSEQHQITLSCADLGLISELDVWVWDIQGNGARCPVSVLLSGRCDTIPSDGKTAFTIAGGIISRNALPLENVEVTLNADLGEYPLVAQTGETGAFSFLNNPYLHSYELVAYKDVDHLNGVTTADLVRLRSHILNINRLTSPYDLLAADINRDGSITAIDMVILTKLILGNISNFPDNESWRFVPADYTFADPSDPWDYPASIIIRSLRRQIFDQNFIGVKVGDLTSDVSFNLNLSAKIREQKHVTFSIEDRHVRSGDIIKLKLTSVDTSIAAVHMTLVHPGLELILAKSEGGTIEFQSSSQSTELIWLGYEFSDQKSSDDFIELEYRVKVAGLLSDKLSIETTEPIKKPYGAYVGNSTMPTAVELIFTDAHLHEAVVHQNEPNPFRDLTVINFVLTSPQALKLTVYDVNGTIVMSRSTHGVVGHNALLIDLSELAGTGVLLYNLESKYFSETSKMIRIR